MGIFSLPLGGLAVERLLLTVYSDRRPGTSLGGGCSAPPPHQRCSFSLLDEPAALGLPLGGCSPRHLEQASRLPKCDEACECARLTRPTVTVNLNQSKATTKRSTTPKVTVNLNQSKATSCPPTTVNQGSAGAGGSPRVPLCVWDLPSGPCYPCAKPRRGSRQTRMTAEMTVQVRARGTPPVHTSHRRILIVGLTCNTQPKIKTKTSVRPHLALIPGADDKVSATRKLHRHRQNKPNAAMPSQGRAEDRIHRPNRDTQSVTRPLFHDWHSKVQHLPSCHRTAAMPKVEPVQAVYSASFLPWMASKTATPAQLPA